MQYAGAGCSCRPALFSNHQEWPQQAQGATIRAAAAGQDVSSRKLILRAFAAADAVFKSAGSLASSVRLKAQAKLIADPEGRSKPAGKPAGVRVSEAEISRRPGSHWYDWYAAKFARAKNA